MEFYEIIFAGYQRNPSRNIIRNPGIILMVSRREIISPPRKYKATTVCSDKNYYNIQCRKSSCVTPKLLLMEKLYQTRLIFKQSAFSHVTPSSLKNRHFIDVLTKDFL